MGSNQQKYSQADFRLAIEESGASIAGIARRLDCATGTVYSYLKRFPDLKAKFESLKGVPVEAQPQFPKELFEKAIKDSHGIKASVMAAVGCSRQTVENAFERWPELRVQLEVARASLVNDATSKLVMDINERESKNHFQAYMFVLKTFGKDEGFVERSEVTGADGRPVIEIPPELMKQLEATGLNVVEVLRNLAAMPPPVEG